MQPSVLFYFALIWLAVAALKPGNNPRIGRRRQSYAAP
jgi:hypothetical protein